LFFDEGFSSHLPGISTVTTFLVLCASKTSKSF